MSTFAPSKGQNNEFKIIKVMKKELKKINVMTLRNGYALKVDGESYMYYNQQSLLEGMLVRIGMDRHDEMTKDDLHAMVEAIKDGSAIKQLQEQIAAMQTTNEDLRRQIRTLKRHAKRNNMNNND
jgi:hypothetical protein